MCTISWTKSDGDFHLGLLDAIAWCLSEAWNADGKIIVHDDPRRTGDADHTRWPRMSSSYASTPPFVSNASPQFIIHSTGVASTAPTQTSSINADTDAKPIFRATCPHVRPTAKSHENHKLPPRAATAAVAAAKSGARAIKGQRARCGYAILPSRAEQLSPSRRLKCLCSARVRRACDPQPKMLPKPCRHQKSTEQRERGGGARQIRDRGDVWTCKRRRGRNHRINPGSHRSR